MTDTAALRALAEPFLQQCGSCDAGLPMSCACADGDPRPVIGSLLDRLVTLEAENQRLREDYRKIWDMTFGAAERGPDMNAKPDDIEALRALLRPVGSER